MSKIIKMPGTNQDHEDEVMDELMDLLTSAIDERRTEIHDDESKDSHNANNIMDINKFR